MQKSYERLPFIDLLRSAAILCVVLCHAVESIYSNEHGISSSSSFFAVAAFTLGRLGVPVFLMITGYLLLDRDYDDEACKKFWKNNWLHLFVCTEVWFAIYELFIHYYRGMGTTFGKVVLELLFLQKVGMSHDWYLPVILGLYPLIPFVSKALKLFEAKTLFFPFKLFSVYVFTVPVLNTILLSEGYSSAVPLLSTGFSGGAYGLYIVLGFFAKKGIFKKDKSISLILLSVISFAAAIFLQIFAFCKGYQYILWYDCLFVFLCALGIFILFSRIKRVRAYGVVRFVSQYSFAVYLIHNMVLEIFLPYIKQSGFPLPVRVVVLSIAVFLFSIFVAVVIGRIPKIGKYILYAK